MSVPKGAGCQHHAEHVMSPSGLRCSACGVLIADTLTLNYGYGVSVDKDWMIIDEFEDYEYPDYYASDHEEAEDNPHMVDGVKIIDMGD